MINKKTLYSLIVLTFIFSPFSVDAKNIPEARDYFLKGDKNSSFKVVTYTDFDCPFCNRFHPTLEKMINKYQNEDVSFSYRSFPLTEIHPDALPAALVFECLNRVSVENRNIEFSSRLFDLLSYSSGVTSESLNKYDFSELDKEKLMICLADEDALDFVVSKIEKYSDVLSKDRNFGTPYTVISHGKKELVMPGAQSFEAFDKSLADFIKENKKEIKQLSNADKLKAVEKIAGKDSDLYRLVKMLIDLKII